MADDNGSILAAVFWMFLISLLLFWRPFVGPLIAGIVGGKYAGGVGGALMAVFQEDLKRLWKYRHKGYARRFWEGWFQRALDSGLAPLQRRHFLDPGLGLAGPRLGAGQ